MRTLRSAPQDHHVCGWDKLIFFDSVHRSSWLFVCPANVSKPWLAGGTLCYKKKFWEKKKFDDMTYGEDTQFLWSREDIKLLPIPDFTFYVAIIHPANTIPKNVNADCRRSYPITECRKIMGEFHECYHRNIRT
ncbi:MAG: hypothetical protein GY765_10340 [bacterium]|nr:hypothetical protein [bacterium]